MDELVDFVPNKNAMVRKDAPMHPSMNHPTPYELRLQFLSDSTISVANKNGVSLWANLI